MSNLVKSLKAIGNIVEGVIFVAGVAEFIDDISKSELRKELVTDIRHMTPKALACLPKEGSRFHVDENLPEGEAYWEFSVFKTADTNHGYPVNRITLGLSHFELRGIRRKLHQVRVTRPVMDIELHDGWIVGLRTDGDTFAPSIPLERADTQTLRNLKNAMIAVIDRKVTFKKGHPMAEIV